MKSCTAILFTCFIVIVPHVVTGTDFDAELSVGTTFNVDVASAPLMVGNYGNQNYLNSNPDCPLILGDHSYATQAFSTINAGSHDMETVAATGGVDTFIALYSPAFDPNNPTADLVTCDDDGGAAWPLSRITANLVSGAPYEVVVTTWNANPVDGTISWQILPDIVLGAVAAIPTLSEWGLIIFSIFLGTAAVWTIRRKIRENAA